MTRPQADLAGPDVRSLGPWPFVTHRSFRRGGQRVVRRARQARKGLERRLQTLDAHDEGPAKPALSIAARIG